MNPFQHIIDEARTWVGPTWKFVEIGEIHWVSCRNRGGEWYGPECLNGAARIVCGWEDTIDLVWHEVFHSVFHNSPMKGYDPLWMEGWCNAFSEVHHRNFKTPVYDESYHTRTYLIPCDSLLKQASFDASVLKIMWMAWNNPNYPQKPGAFSDFMGYAPIPKPE